MKNFLDGQQGCNDSSCINLAAFGIYLNQSTDMIFVKDANLVYQAASLPFVRMAGKQSALEIIGRTDFEIFSDQELAKRYTDDDKKLLADGRDMISYIEPLTDAQGHPRYSSTSKYVLHDSCGNGIGLLGISRDITREYVARRRYQQELQYLFELPEDTYAALFMDIDDWRIIRHHRHKNGENVLLHCETMEQFAANALKNLADSNDVKSRQFFENLTQESLQTLSNSGARTYVMEYIRRMPSGEDIWVRTDIHFLTDPENGHLCAIWTLRDINNIKQQSFKLRQAAEQDEMTGVLNRASTMRQIEEVISSEEQAQHALFVIDVDNFKQLNDTYGHQAGDRFLVTLAKTLKQCFREYDLVGRIGGDEFFVFMKNVPSSAVVADKARMLLAVSQIFCDEYPDLNLSVSMGISMCPLNGSTLDMLYTNADKALYQAKHDGKSRFVFSGELME